MIRLTTSKDFYPVLEIINDAAQAYQGVIPLDCWHEPYMSEEALRQEIAAGVIFRGYEASGRLQGVMGLQSVRDVTLIRHAYVRTDQRRRGIGGQLLISLSDNTPGPVLMGTWAAAIWAIQFYEKHGFRLIEPVAEKDRLLSTYWSLPARQIETSVVLANPAWFTKPKS